MVTLEAVKTISLYIFQKNMDLHCKSAFEAISKLLGYTPLLRLRKFGYWDIRYDGDHFDKDQGAIQKLVDDTYYLLNLNKEGYCFDYLSLPKLKEGQQLVVCRVKNKVPLDNSNLLRKIHKSTPSSFSDFRYSTVWEFVLDSNQPIGDLQQELMEQVIVARSRTKGLLCNPIYETVEFLDTSQVYS